MALSSQHNLSGAKAPRVHITYDVETDGAPRRKELPFKVGVLAPLSGNGSKKASSLRERKMVSVERGNFDSVLAAINPNLNFKVKNTVQENGSDLAVNLSFLSMSDFSPLAIVEQVPALNEMHSSRSKLRDLMSKLDSQDALVGALSSVVLDEERLQKVTNLFAEAKSEIEAAGNQEDPSAVMSAIPEEELQEGSELHDLIHGSGMALEEFQVPYCLELLSEFFNHPELSSTAKVEGGSLAAALSSAMSMLDSVISRQLNHVLHNGEFQELEASWRGLAYLVNNTQTGSNLKLSVLSVSFEELFRDLDKAVEFDQSALFKIIYEDEFGTYGGEPYSLLIGDFQIGRTNKEIALLEKVSQVAAAAHVPFISSAYAKLFDLEDFESLSKPRDLSKIFESAELTRWRNFRDSEDSRYVALTLPRVMMRLPYGSASNPADGLMFEEEVGRNVYQVDDQGNPVKGKDGRLEILTATDAAGLVSELTRKQTDASKILWGNPAYLLATNINAAFSRYGWTAAIRGVDGGGLVSGLPAYSFETEDGEVTLSCPTQVAITDRREKELNDLGFISLCHCKGTNKAAFFGGQTTNKPKKYLNNAATKNSEVSAMLPYMLAASRFAHYIKVMMRERIGSFSTGQSVQDFLNSWISQYVLLDDTAPSAVKARFPLREARITVTEDEEKVGSFKATVFLRPHFQLEELSTSIRLVAELPA